MNIKKRSENNFEEIKIMDEEGNEYWSARELALALDYSDYRNFKTVIHKAQGSCKNSQQKVLDHFVDVTDMVVIGSGSQRELEDILLSRYACYLIVQNADPRKEIVALGQTYFAIQTRRKELEDDENFSSLTEDEKRVLLREELKVHNKHLASAAKDAGVKAGIEFAVFQDHGYRGLYGGLGAREIHRRKQLKKSQQILDHMSSGELAANLFRATQTEEKIRREKIQGKSKANKAHHQVGAKVRQTIKELGGTMPEDMPKPAKSIGQAKRTVKKLK
ncbi:MAG: DNA damage-inducible protein D [Candidatus Melainabacteria bacterium]|nr:DNA damage-inducible protein D [Candidatus Melainabacteria bacterium]